MKRIVQKLFGLFGVKLVRTGARKQIPKPNLDNIEIVVSFYAMLQTRINLLQIGACDGVTSDSIYKYIRAGFINAFLVEPSKVNFAQLQQFYSGYSNVTLINVAIATENEQRTFYTIKNEGRWKDDGGARQLASFYKEHVLRHGILESEIAEEIVDCRTIASIIKEYRIPDLDVLVVDTEGYDGEIIKMALAQNVRPTFIAFENGQLPRFYSQDQLDSLYSQLSQAGYRWTHDRINTLAVRNDFFLKQS